MITRTFGACTVHAWDHGGLLAVDSRDDADLDPLTFQATSWQEASWDEAVRFAFTLGLEPDEDPVVQTESHSIFVLRALP